MARIRARSGLVAEGGRLPSLGGGRTPLSFGSSIAINEVELEYNSRIEEFKRQRTRDLGDAINPLVLDRVVVTARRELAADLSSFAVVRSGGDGIYGSSSNYASTARRAAARMSANLQGHGAFVNNYLAGFAGDLGSFYSHALPRAVWNDAVNSAEFLSQLAVNVGHGRAGGIGQAPLVNFDAARISYNEVWASEAGRLETAAGIGGLVASAGSLSIVKASSLAASSSTGIGIVVRKAPLSATSPSLLARAQAQGLDVVDLTIKYKSGWTEAQRAAARQKLQALTDADTFVVKSPIRGPKSPRSMFKQAGNPIPAGADIDHVVELQLGGLDHLNNLRPLNASVNRSIGSSIRHATNNLPAGTVIDTFRIID